MITRHGRRLLEVSNPRDGSEKISTHVESVSETGDDARDDELRVAVRRRLQDRTDGHDTSSNDDCLSTTQPIAEP